MVCVKDGLGKPEIDICFRRPDSVREDGGELVGDNTSCLVGINPGGEV